MRLPAASIPARGEPAGRSPAYVRMIAWIHRVAPSELPVLVHGESGSGKEGVCRMIHRRSRRAAAPFVPVNCCALTDSLVEAELFGAVRGAYTGGERDRPGLFRQAHGGTLFLDEIADTPPAMQAKLLRALQEGRVRPVGATEEQVADVRVVAASNKSLQDEVQAGRFRADLFHRLAVVEVEVPPLRERVEDLPALTQALGPRIARETGLGTPRLSAAALQILRSHWWPGNVREFHAVLARAVLRSNGNLIGPEHLRDLTITAGPPSSGLECSMIERALKAAGGGMTPAAAKIGWTRQKLYRRMKALGLTAPRASSI